MKTALNSFIVLAIALTGSISLADGFKCSGGGFQVKLFNHVHPSEGTRNPAVMVLSSEDDGTLFVRKGNSISKTNRLSTVRYTVEGIPSLGANVILQVQFKQGQESIEAGETCPGQLIFAEDNDREVVMLECERYLKQG